MDVVARKNVTKKLKKIVNHYYNKVYNKDMYELKHENKISLLFVLKYLLVTSYVFLNRFLKNLAVR